MRLEVLFARSFLFARWRRARERLQEGIDVGYFGVAQFFLGVRGHLVRWTTKLGKKTRKAAWWGNLRPLIGALSRCAMACITGITGIKFFSICSISRWSGRLSVCSDHQKHQAGRAQHHFCGAAHRV